MGVFYIGDREGRCGVFRRLCVGMILGWDFYWFGVGRGCDVFLWGGRVRKGRSWGRVDVLIVIHDLYYPQQQKEIPQRFTLSAKVNTTKEWQR